MISKRAGSPAWESALSDFAAALRAGGAPASTIRVRVSHVRRMSRGVDGDPWAVTTDALTQWAGRQEWAIETRRAFRSSAIAFYRWGIDAGRCTQSPAAKLPRVRQSEPLARPAPEIVYREALARSEARERLMLRLSAEAGMRRAEVAQAHTADLIEDLAGWSIVVHGKGGKDRMVPLSASLAAELHTVADGYVFPGNDDGHLSADWVGKLVGRLLPGRHTMHSLRHRFATKAYGVERDVFAVQELLGHASPVTTRRYVQVPRDDLRRTVEAVGRAS